MNRDLSEIKQDYQNIKVPDTLKPRVADAIAKAKADMANTAGTPNLTGNTASHTSSTPLPSHNGNGPANVPKKETCAKTGLHSKAAAGKDRRKTELPFHSPFAKAAGAAAAAALALIILANLSPSISYAMEQVPVIGAIVKVVTFREYGRQDNQMEANLKIPEVQISGDENGENESLKDAAQELNGTIKAYTDEMIAAYEADVKAADGEGTQAVDLDYEVVTDNDRLFSLRFCQTVTMAGATQMEKIYHIDKQAGKMVTLEDLFQEGADYKTPISENIKQQMKEQMAQDESKSYYIGSDVPEWDFKELPDNANFYVNKSGKLVVVFDEYQVAPGYMGVVTFEIPTETVADIVKDGYLK